MKKIQIVIKSLDKISVQLYVKYLKKILNKIQIKKLNIQNLPLKKKRITLLKSPHVNKSAREQFEIQIHQTIINFIDLKFENLLKFLAINKPKNIKLKFKMIF